MISLSLRLPHWRYLSTVDPRRYTSLSDVPRSWEAFLIVQTVARLPWNLTVADYSTLLYSLYNSTDHRRLASGDIIRHYLNEIRMLFTVVHSCSHSRSPVFADATFPKVLHEICFWISFRKFCSF